MKKSILLTILTLVLSIISCTTSQKEQNIFSEKTLKEDIFVRKNAHSKDGKSDLDALAIAMDKMQDLPCDNPLSWYYQGAIHWVPDSIPNNPLCDKYHETSDALTGWRACTHFKEGSQAREINFLIWHRLYILHFEKIVRELSGKSDFALPYWDYTNPDYNKLPSEFINQKSSLFESARVNSLNNGKAISDSIMDNALNIEILFKNTIFDTFNRNMESAPHGTMHNYIGGYFEEPKKRLWWNRIFQKDTTGLMAEVGSAGFDPIFWLHHSNVDRLWEKWERSPNGARISLDTLKKYEWPYLFFDSKGQEINFTIEQAYEKAFNVNYTYDDIKKEEKPQKIFVQTQDTSVVINSQKLDIGLTEESNFSVKWDIPEVSSFKSNDNSRVIWVLTVNISFEKAPKGLYEVFIKDKSSDKIIESQESLKGVMSFFGAEHHKEMGHSMHHSENENRTLTKFVFDITDEIDLDSSSVDVDFRIKRKAGSEDDLKIEDIVLEQRQIKGVYVDLSE